MRLLIVGASRGTGAAATCLALERGHDVAAFARHPEALTAEHPRLSRMSGSFHDRAAVGAAMADREAVIVTASAKTLSGFKQMPDYFSRGTAVVIEAMKASGARRLAILSAFGVGASRAAAGYLTDKLIISLLLRRPFEDHERQEQMVRDSGLAWVIARPTRLTNGPARGRYVRTSAVVRVPAAISRADVADFLVEACETDDWVGQAVQLGG
jgi:uncharacterized protein YbjT (DUF2867 family)